MTMPRAKRVRRLSEIRPGEVARTLERALQRDRKTADDWLTQVDEVDEDEVPMTKLSEVVRKLTSYAQGDATNRPHEAARYARKLLSETLSNMVVQVPPDDPMLERIDPYLSELTVICAAVLGRFRVEVEKASVPDAWLAALCSVKKGSIRTYLCLPDKPVFLERPAASRTHVTYQSAMRYLEKHEEMS